MYVSDDIIFVHIPRCGGTSIRSALAAPEHFKTAIPTAAKSHDTAAQAREIIGQDAWDRAWTFTVVRNPWDRLISLYYLCLSPNDSGQPFTRLRKGLQRVGRKDPTPEYLHNEILERGFEWWLLEFCERYRWNPWRLDPDRPITRIQASEWVFDPDGRMLLDRAFRFETDWGVLLEELGARRGITEMPHFKQNAQGRDRSEYFSTEGLNRWVEANFAQDIEAFGYGR